MSGYGEGQYGSGTYGQPAALPVYYPSYGGGYAGLPDAPARVIDMVIVVTDAMALTSLVGDRADLGLSVTVLGRSALALNVLEGALQRLLVQDAVAQSMAISVLT